MIHDEQQTLPFQEQSEVGVSFNFGGLPVTAFQRERQRKREREEIEGCILTEKEKSN